ncbi:unnamed protein product [Lepidochelys kempii]
MNLKTVLVLLVLALVTIFALVCVLLTRGVKPTSCEPQTLSTLQGNHSDQSLVFADLTPEEMVQVVTYLQENLGVPLVDASQANPSDNCIYYIDVQLPTKAEVLGFLDRGGKRPSRQALAVVYFGNQPDPNVTEYVVGPLPTPTTHQDITVQKYGGKLPYHRRPVLDFEYKLVAGFLRRTAFPTALTFLSQVLDYDGTNLAAMTSAPRGFQSGDRNTWFILFHNVSGFFLHPVGLEVLVDHSSLDVSQWRVSKVFFNGQYYGDLVQLEREFKQGHVKVDPVKRAPPDGGFSSMQPRAAPRAPFPLQYEPHGPRYSVQNNQVVSWAWSFAFGVNVNTGMRLFDIRFKGERIVYEISVQDAISVYGSNCPGGMSTRYMDGSFGIGRFTYPLVRGVDCPYSATYVDTCYLAQSPNPRINKNSICIFEENTGSPLRRHYSNLQSLYYGGLTNSALVLRSIATLGNYDYVWDFIFYENGAIEAKVHATGYMTSSFLYGDGLDYGNRVGDHTLGTIHTHSIHYKVDLDVGVNMNLKTVLILLVLALATIFALVCVLLTRGVKPASCEPQNLSTLQGNHSDQSLVFADLTPEEMVQVVTYLQSSLGVPLVDAYNANPSDNCIYYIDVQLPTKAEVLGFLDRGGKRPSRQALAVVYFGNQPDPNVTEYVVGPLPTPTTHQDITVQKYGGKLPYHRRPVLGKEYEQIEIFLRKEAFSTAPTFLSQVLDYDGTNFASLTSAPRGFQSGDRNTWFILFHNVSGFFLHPVGLEVLVDHSSLDVSQWRVSKVFFNGQYYGDLVQLEREFKQGHVKVDPVKRAPPDGGFSSMQPRAAPRAPFPLQYEPHGPRYSVQNNQVVSRAWSFAFGVNVNTGMRLFDIRFKGERIVYEISVQDAISVYGSNCPGGMSTRYMDGSFGIGRFTYPLVRGVDCPYSATYVDTCYLIETQTPEKHKNSICIFEENTGSPLRRHYSNLQSLYYGGLTNSALVLRSIATLGNYDYVWDFIFYENGAIEAKVHATGYMTSSFLYGDGLDYGNKVGDHTLGTIHTHSIHYKVDLDVGGTYNTLVAHDMAFESVQAPWSPEHQIQRPRLTKTVLDTEDKAAFRLHSNMPRYIYFAANSENKWGHQRGYRIQIVSFTGEHLPETSLMERAISWGRYKLAVTKRKEEEPTSSSIYNQNDPWTPTVAFADFINNESIVTEDLVAWITTGFLHIPHAEDIPNTVTVGNGVSILLRPYNYYDTDPSIYSPDGVFFSSEQDSSVCEVNHIACLSKTASCLPVLPPFTYDGFQNLTRL